MNITDFAKTRGIEPQTVSKYISRHSEEFAGMVERSGKSVSLSDEAVAMLEKVYPNPKPVEVIIDHDSRDKLLQAQEQIILLQQRLADQSDMIAEARFQKMLLEQKEAELSDRDKRISEQSAIIQELENQLKIAAENLEGEREQRRQMENAGFFRRVFKKWR